jgi:hypothetical protein
MKPAKILFAVAHYYNPAGGDAHGSLSASPQVDVVVCTTGGNHLLDHPQSPRGLIRHHSTTADSKLLGFEGQTPARTPRKAPRISMIRSAPEQGETKA